MYRNMLAAFAVCTTLSCTTFAASAWELPKDGEIMPLSTVQEILDGADFPEVSGFSKAVDYVDYPRTA